MGSCKASKCPVFRGREVPYAGSTDSKVVMLGESPGVQEVKKGVPFYEKAPSGQLIREVVEEAGLEWDALFNMNSARCLIDKKKLSGKEVTKTLAFCRPKIAYTFKYISPKCIILLGDFALRQVLRRSGITKARGQWVYSEEFECWIMPTFHPSYILRNMALRGLMLQDLRKVAAFVANNYDVKVEAENTDYVITNRVGPHIDTGSYLGIDTETQGLDWKDPNFVPVSYSVSWKEGSARQIVLHEECKEGEEDFTITWPRIPQGEKKPVPTQVYVKRSEDFDQKLSDLQFILGHPTIKLCMQNGNYDVHVFRTLFRRARASEIEIRAYVCDTQAAAHCLDENIFKMASLGDLQAAFSNYEVDYKEEFLQKHDMLSASQEEASEYACADADVTRRIGISQRDHLLDSPKVANYFVRFAMPVLQTVLVQLEENGVQIDTKALPVVRDEITKEMAVLQKKAEKKVSIKIREQHAEKGFKLTRRVFIADVLFEKDGFGLEPVKKTKSKEAWSVDKETRITLLDRPRLGKTARKFLETYNVYSELDELRKKFKGYEKFLTVDSRIHTHLSMTIAVTGRLSCVPLDAEMLTVNGWKKYDQLIVGEDVVSYDVQNGKLVISNLKNIHLGRGKVGTLYYRHGKTRKVGVRCTENHTWVVEKNTIRGFISAKDVGEARGCRLILSSKVDAAFGQDDDARSAAIVGWALTDGHVGTTSSGRYFLEVTLKKPQSVAKFRRQVCVGYSYIQYDGERSRFAIGVELFDGLWKRVNSFQNIVSYIVSLTPRARKEMWDAMMEADGSIRKYGGGREYPSFMERFGSKDSQHVNKPNVGDAFSALAVLLGKAIRYRSRKSTGGRAPFTGWEISENKRKIPKYERGSNVEHVWCPETGAGTWIIRQNGVVGITGNSSKPNMMNTPTRSKSAKKVRKVIIAKSGHVLLAADMEQSELRWCAHVSNDQEMKRVFMRGEDIHTNTAKALVPRPWDQMDADDQKFYRRAAKSVNFGLIFLMSARGFVKYAKLEYDIELTEHEAKKWIEVFFRKYSGILGYHKRTIAFCRAHGYVESELGRRRRLPEIHSRDNFLRAEAERQAVNAPIQGPSSDAVLLSCKELLRKKKLPPPEIKPVLFIHDELIFEVKKGLELKYAKIIKPEMEHPPFKRDFGFEFSVPAVASFKIGPNLAEMTELEV